MQQASGQQQPSQMGSGGGGFDIPSALSAIGINVGGGQGQTGYGAGQQPSSYLGQGQYGSTGISSNLNYRLRNWWNNMQQCFQRCLENLRVYVNRYPPLAAFLFTLILFSSLPVAMFLLFVTLSTLGTLSVALIGFALVDGVMVFVASGILLAILSVITLFSTIGFSWIAVIYMLYRGVINFYHRISGTPLGQQLQGMAQMATEKFQNIQQNIPGVSGSYTGAGGPTSGGYSSVSGAAGQQQPRSFF